MSRLGSQLGEQIQQHPELFIGKFPKILLHVIENDLEKFTSYLQQYQEYFGDRQLRFLVTERLQYSNEWRIKLVTFCEMYNRAEMCLEISKYFPDWIFNLNQAYTRPMFDFAYSLEKTFDIEPVMESSLVFRSKMLSYPVKVKFTDRYFRGMVSDLMEMSRQLSTCLPLLTKIDNPDYQLSEEEKDSLSKMINLASVSE